MNILFTTVKAPEKSPFSTTEKLQPIGIGILASLARDKGHTVFFKDPYTDPKDNIDLDYLTKNEIDIIGIYICTPCWKEAKILIEELGVYRSQGWSGKIVLGGPHTYIANGSDYPDGVDYVIKGEAEYTFLNLIDIIYKKIEHKPLNSKKPYILYGINPESLDYLPIPAYDLFENKPYNGYGNIGKVFNMSSSRGCPYNCMFCSSSSLSGRNYRFLSPKRIIEHIKFLKDHHDVGYLQIRENNFCVKNQRVLEFCDLYKQSGFPYFWYVEGSVRDLNFDLLREMKDAGCGGIYIGFESASQRILDMIKPGVTVKKNEQVALWCNDIGLKIFATYLVGLPFEKEIDISFTEQFVKEFNPKGVNWINVFVGIPGSKLYKDVEGLWYQDDIGLRYNPCHNELVKRFYGDKADKYTI